MLIPWSVKKRTQLICQSFIWSKLLRRNNFFRTKLCWRWVSRYVQWSITLTTMLSNWIENSSILYAQIMHAIGVFEQSVWKNLHISLSESIVDEPEFYYGSQNGCLTFKKIIFIIQFVILRIVCFTSKLYSYPIFSNRIKTNNKSNLAHNIWIDEEQIKFNG